MPSSWSDSSKSSIPGAGIGQLSNLSWLLLLSKDFDISSLYSSEGGRGLGSGVGTLSISGSICDGSGIVSGIGSGAGDGDRTGDGAESGEEMDSGSSFTKLDSVCEVTSEASLSVEK